MQTPGQLAGHLQASVGFNNKAKLIPGLSPQKSGPRTGPSSPYGREDHLREVRKQNTHTKKKKNLSSVRTTLSGLLMFSAVGSNEAEKYPRGPGPQKQMHRSVSVVLREN